MTDTTQTTEMTTQRQSDVPMLSRPRLPYHPLIEERFGIDRASWKFLADVLYPTAEEPETIINVLAYCKARKLDVMKKPVHIVPVWDRKRKKMVDSVWPAIAEVRITAMRTGLYAGRDETVFGPDRTEMLGGIEVTYPEWAQLTVYRFVAGQACAFVGEKVRWREYYAKAGRDTLAPNDMWKTKTYSQIAKCAEANALRCAFPEEDGGPTAEEMHGQEVETVTSTETVTGPSLSKRLGNAGNAGFDAEAVQALENKPSAPPQKGHVVEHEAIDAEIETIEPVARAETPPHPTTQEPPKARDEINGPAPRGVVYMLAGDPVSDAGRVPTYKDGEKHSNCGEKGAAELARYTMHPSAPVTADDGDDGFPGDRPVSSGVEAPEAAPTTQDATTDEWEPLERTEGPAPRGVEYTLADDPIEADDTVQAYEDGEPTRFVALRDYVGLPEYTAHPEPAHEAAAELVEEPGSTLFDEMANDTSWLQVKARLPKINNDPEFLALPPEEQDAIRRGIWAVVMEIKKNHKDPIDFIEDPSAFRLWMATQVGPEGADAVAANLAYLQKSTAFGRMKDEVKADYTAKVEAIIARMRA